MKERSPASTEQRTLWLYSIRCFLTTVHEDTCVNHVCLKLSEVALENDILTIMSVHIT